MEMDTWNTKKTAVLLLFLKPITPLIFFPQSCLRLDLRFSHIRLMISCKVKYLATVEKSSPHSVYLRRVCANWPYSKLRPGSLSSIRSREMSIKIIIQAVNQLESLYKSDWKTIFNNCATHLFLGTNDKDTMEYYSTRSGKQTIRTRSTSKSHSYRNGSSSENKQIQGRPSNSR